MHLATATICILKSLTRKERLIMLSLVGIREKARMLWRSRERGQTMTEYALILAAIAIVVFVTYEVMGQDIGSLVNKINTALTST
jgi:Flp pilus assembly pilin Flp